MKKPSFVPAFILLAAIILLGLSDSIDNHVLQIKIGFTGKILLIIGVLGLWALTILPMWGRKNSERKK